MIDDDRTLFALGLTTYVQDARKLEGIMSLYDVIHKQEDNKK